MENIVVFGASGQLGQCFKNLSEKYQLKNLFFPSETEANILDNEALNKIFDIYKPTYIINCAAYTAVDKAEDDIEFAQKINKIGVENLSRLCLKNNTTFIHISTDFVFQGNHTAPNRNAMGLLNLLVI